MAYVTEPRPKRARLARFASILVILIGVLFVAAGAGSWYVVSETLRAEGITVSDDARFLAGAPVADPITAYLQADVITTHALEASGGQSYAELDRNDPERESAMTAAFLRTSLFTSVISFGIAAFAVGVGVVAILLGWITYATLRARTAVAYSYAAQVAHATQTGPIAQIA